MCEKETAEASFMAPPGGMRNILSSPCAYVRVLCVCVRVCVLV